MATLWESSSFLVTVKPDGSGFQDFTTTPLPSGIPVGGVSYLSGETLLERIAGLSWDTPPTSMLVGFLVPGASGVTIQDDRSEVLEIPLGYWWASRFPLFRWQLIPNDLSGLE
jgi:hypothetical protein